jgi:DNA (cytosine-5)-methyltransferase 1
MMKMRNNTAMTSIETENISDLPTPWTMHEFFAGSGLVAYGLDGAFRSVWSNDICAKKAAVYKANFSGEYFVLDDIKNITGALLPYAHLSWASFPCQDLSLAGALRGIDAKRSGLVWEWIRILSEMSKPPSILLAENVAGLLSANKGKNYTKLHYALLELGYKSGAMLIDAAHFVPQSRPRVFIIAVKQEMQVPSELQNPGPNWLHSKATIRLGESLPDWIWWYAPQPPKRSNQLSDVIDFSLPYDKNYVLGLVPTHHKNVIDNFENIVATGYRRMRSGKQCLELRFDGIAGCLRTPEGGSSKQFLIVKSNGKLLARVIAPREAARLMGVPDCFILPKNINDAFKAMGDAVAVPVASYVGHEFLVKLAKVAYSGQRDRAS